MRQIVAMRRLISLLTLLLKRHSLLSTELVIVIALALLFGFFNGMRDSSSIVATMISFLVRHAPPTINDFFRRGQLITALALAFSHGTNDAQKTMGIITLSLLISRQLTAFAVPSWVILASAATMSIGTLLGGRRLIHTLGSKFYKIRPVHSFATQLTSALVVLSASLIGLPASTTQVVSSAIIGVGSSERFGQVRWGVADDIVTTWVVTIPASALLSGCIYWLVVNFT